MLKVIDLDAQGKDHDGFVITLTVGAEKVGITDLELSEMIKARYAGGKGKRQATRRTAAQDSLPDLGLNGDGEGIAQDGADPAH